MHELSKSYKRILKSTTITGGASITNIFIGIIRTKVIAILLGPTGIGLIGLYQSLVSTASTISGLGVPIAASREIAEAVGSDNQREISEIRQALFIGTCFLAGLGGVSFWSLRDILATHTLGDQSQSTAIGWMSIAVSLSIISASQMAILQGRRRISDLAKLSIYSAILGSIGGLYIIWEFDQAGIAAFIIAVPAASVCFGFYFIGLSGNLAKLSLHIKLIISRLKVMGKLGLSLFTYTVLEQITFLLIRANISSTLGVIELGYFQAGWTIAVNYLGVITGAMSSDFLPRIAEKTGQNSSINKLINQQTEIGLLIAGPIIIIMMGLTPAIISVMYSSNFLGATDTVRLLLLSDILRLISWPIGFALLGMGDGTTFSRQGPIQLIVLYASFYIMLPYIGLISFCFSMILMQSISFIWGYRYIFLKTGFKLDKKNKYLFITYSILSICTYLISFCSELFGAIFAILVALVMAFISFRDIRRKISMI